MGERLRRVLTGVVVAIVVGVSGLTVHAAPLDEVPPPPSLPAAGITFPE